ncbi:hypothetical protein CEXT_493771 [Caerostris extrusa]|uniref:Uncharacterized protein n=1 Tax=Caerostris extrusa TaxID=172846 RepID=A0AAV4T376_CAEEX|nr:hypothetical protein CEXT_493771 [Caerostris extrusa]
MIASNSNQMKCKRVCILVYKSIRVCQQKDSRVSEIYRRVLRSIRVIILMNVAGNSSQLMFLINLCLMQIRRRRPTREVGYRFFPNFEWKVNPKENKGKSRQRNGFQTERKQQKGKVGTKVKRKRKKKKKSNFFFFSLLASFHIRKCHH